MENFIPYPRPIDPSDDWQELDARSGDGLEISLLWSRAANAVKVAVRDLRLGREFDVNVDPRHARRAFRHPFAYA
jgi:hypothetical protein